MNGFREHLCLSTSWLTDWIQAYFHHNGCIWIAAEVIWIKGFYLSLQWGFGLVSLFLVCKVFCSMQSWSLPEPGLVWRWTSFMFPISPSPCSRQPVSCWDRSPSPLWSCSAGDVVQYWTGAFAWLAWWLPLLGSCYWTPRLFLALNHVAFNLLAFSEIELYMCKHFEKHYMLLVN